ncbi:MAG: hypothetical protein ACI8RZ_002398, partial [Myxococcota bacterium]
MEVTMFSVPAELSVLALVGLILAIIIKSLRDQGAGWAAFAESSGLTYSRAFLRPRLTGTFQGHTVEANIYQRTHRASGKRRSKAYTRFKVGIRIPMPAGTLIRHEGMMEAMAQMMGEEEVKLGDPALDSALWI